VSKLIEKLFKSYRDQLLHLAKLYGIVEVKGYARSAKKLTTSQLELLLIKNRIKLPINRSSDKAIARQELKENFSSCSDSNFSLLPFERNPVTALLAVLTKKTPSESDN